MTERLTNQEMLNTATTLHRERQGTVPEKLISQILEAEAKNIEDSAAALKEVERLVEKYLEETG